MEINGLLLSIYKEEIISLVFSNLNELFHKIWIKSITETKDVQESLYSVCFFNDLLEYISFASPSFNYNVKIYYRKKS